MAKLRVGRATYKVEPGGASITVELNGKAHTFTAEQKLFKEHGLIFLGGEWTAKLPPITLPADPAEGRNHPIVLRGFTRDEQIRRIYQKYLDSDGFAFEGVINP